MLLLFATLLSPWVVLDVCPMRTQQDGSSVQSHPITTTSCPDLCRCYLATTPRRVDCSGAGLTLFPSSLHSSTQLLDLSDNYISDLPKRISEITPQLEILILRHNIINRVEEKCFEGLSELRTIDLSYNNLTGILPAYLVHSNHRLIELKLNYNIHFKQTSHLYSSSLEILDLSGCKIGRINGSHFLNLTSLRMLNISHNPLVIEPGTNITIPTLRVLDLTHCHIITLPSYLLSGLPRLKQLHVANNRKLDLTRNPPLTSKSLLLLTADHCNIQHVSLAKLPALTHAYLSCNKITTIKRENFARNSALLELDLSQNLIRSLPGDVFIHAVRLVSLDLSRNQIESLKYDSFSCCKELKFLNLTRNDIIALPSIFTMPSLSVFDLSRCRIAALPTNPDFLSSMLQLQQLYISHNEFQTIPDLVSYTVKLLDLSYCHLTYITNHTFSNMTALQYLDLSGNRLTSLDAKDFENNDRLGILKLDNNPWRCNCSDVEFKSLYELAQLLSETGRTELKCNDPENVTGKYWDDACKPSESSDSSANSLITYILVLLIVAAFAVILYCTKRIIRRPKQTRQRIAAERNSRGSSDSSDTESVPVRQGGGNRECTPCSRGRQQRQLTLSTETQPPSYEEAVLMPTTPSLATSMEQISLADTMRVRVDQNEEIHSYRASFDVSTSSEATNNDMQITNINTFDNTEENAEIASHDARITSAETRELVLEQPISEDNLEITITLLTNPGSERTDL